jgi:hypothetical protein
MTHAYSSPEMEAVRKRREGKKLAAAGVVLLGAGAIGVVLSTVLNVVWLGVLGEPIGALSWLALIAGGACLWLGYSKIRSARQAGA